VTLGQLFDDINFMIGDNKCNKDTEIKLNYTDKDGNEHTVDFEPCISMSEGVLNLDIDLE
jgi:hypothetical protein